MKKRRTKIVDFKNDVLFKFTLRDDQDPDCLYLLKLIIENIAGIECHSLKVQNPELNPQHVEDKDMILDIRVINENGEICDVEMQNSSLDDLDTDNLMLIDKYMTRNDLGKVERYCLITRIYIYLPYINILKKEKQIGNFDELETAIYIFKNGLDDDIIKTGKKVVKIMEKKVEKFNEDMILQDMAFHRDLNKWASHARIQRVREESLREGKQEGLREGKQEGLREGKQEGLKYSVLKLFQKRFSEVETAFLDDLSAEQYEKILDFLLEGATLEDIYRFVNKGVSG